MESSTIEYIRKFKLHLGGMERSASHCFPSQPTLYSCADRLVNISLEDSVKLPFHFLAVFVRVPALPPFVSIAQTGYNDAAPGYELRVSLDSVSARPLELAVRNDGALWVLWYEAGRWISPEGSFAGPPSVEAGNGTAGNFGAHPAALNDGRWLKQESSTRHWDSGWPLPDFSTQTRYFYVTRPSPADTIASDIVVDFHKYSSSQIIDYDQTVTAIRSLDMREKVLFQTTRSVQWGTAAPYVDFRFLIADKTTLAVREVSNFQLWYDSPYVTYKEAGAYFSHTAVVSEEYGGACAVMQHQQNRVDSGSWMVDRYRRNIARYDADGRIQTSWVTLDTVGLQGVDQSFQLIMNDTSSVWIFKREPGGSMLSAEEWTFDGRRLRSLPIRDRVKFTGKIVEYQALRRPGGYVLVWTDVQADSSTDVFLQLFDESMKPIATAHRINSDERGNQYGSVSVLCNDTLNTAWMDERDGTRQVYLRRIPIDALVDVGMQDVPDADIRLEPIFPNPVTGSTRIRYHVPTESVITLTVLDLLCRSRRTFVNAVRQSGEKISTLDCGLYPPGTYIVILCAGTTVRYSLFLVAH